MMNWFQAGGFGMWSVLLIGAGAIGFGVKAIGKPTAERLATLRSLPGLVMLAAIFAFGKNMWAVNQHAFDEAFLKAHGATLADAPAMALMGITESVQPFTLAGVLAAVVLVLRMLADAKKARTEA
jgi:hypothetical protein